MFSVISKINDKIGLPASPGFVCSPPTTDSGYGKTRSIMISSYADPCAIAAQIVDTIGIGLTQFVIHKIVYIHELGLPLRTPLLSTVLVLPN